VKSREPDSLDGRIYRHLCTSLEVTMQSNTRGKIRSPESGQAVARRISYTAKVLRQRLERLPPTQCVSEVNLTNIPAGFSDWIAAIPESEPGWSPQELRSAAIGALDDLMRWVDVAEQRVRRAGGGRLT
jgi:hypothetical protein